MYYYSIKDHANQMWYFLVVYNLLFTAGHCVCGLLMPFLYFLDNTEAIWYRKGNVSSVDTHAILVTIHTFSDGCGPVMDMDVQSRTPSIPCYHTPNPLLLPSNMLTDQKALIKLQDDILCVKTHPPGVSQSLSNAIGIVDDVVMRQRGSLWRSSCALVTDIITEIN